MTGLTNRVAVMTGAGSCIGAAVAAAIVREGAKVVLVDANGGEGAAG